MLTTLGLNSSSEAIRKSLEDVVQACNNAQIKSSIKRYLFEVQRAGASAKKLKVIFAVEDVLDSQDWNAFKHFLEQFKQGDERTRRELELIELINALNQRATTYRMEDTQNWTRVPLHGMVSSVQQQRTSPAHDVSVNAHVVNNNSSEELEGVHDRAGNAYTGTYSLPSHYSNSQEGSSFTNEGLIDQPHADPEDGVISVEAEADSFSDTADGGEPQQPHSLASPDLGLTAAAGTSTNAPIQKASFYINLYPKIEGEYDNKWDRVFQKRGFLSNEDAQKLKNEGINHRSLSDHDFRMHRLHDKHFKAVIAAEDFGKLAGDMSDKAKTLCCMIDQIVANMLVEGMELKHISLTLNAPNIELITAGYLYAKTRYNISDERLTLKVNATIIDESERRKINKLGEKTLQDLRAADTASLSIPKTAKEAIDKMYEEDSDKFIVNIVNVNEKFKALADKLEEARCETTNIKSFLAESTTLIPVPEAFSDTAAQRPESPPSASSSLGSPSMERVLRNPNSRGREVNVEQKGLEKEQQASQGRPLCQLGRRSSF